METAVNFFFLVDRYAAGIAALCIAGLLWVWWWKLRPAQQKLSEAQFGLERELALNRRASAINWAGVFILILLALVAITQVVTPYLHANPVGANTFGLASYEDQFVTRVPGRESAALAGPTPDPLEIVETREAGGMATASPTPEMGILRTPTDIFSGEVDATVTPSSTPPGTIMPDPPERIGCTDESALIIIPFNGQRLFETVVIQGTANSEGFSAYKFELKGPDTGDEWAVLRTYTAPVHQGILGQFDGTAFTPGIYQFRLAVVDVEDRTIASCTITVEVAAPPPTPTPIRYE